MRRIACLILAAVFYAPEAALAHTGHGAVHGFASGFSHPFGGLDHLLAMFAVGLLAVQLGGRALWLVPASFVLTMIAGSLAGLAGMALPGAEFAITISIAAIALPVAFALGVPVPLAMAWVALFAFFHGYAHGAELPAGASVASYMAGFALATALIHASGIAAGLLAGRIASRAKGMALRAAGAVVALVGVTIFII